MTPRPPPPTLWACLVGSLLAACARSPRPASTEEPPGADAILFLSLDTLRADRTSLYGYGRPTTPRLEELAAGATVYRRVLAAAPWTLPSHASMFTGLFPYEHGAHTVALTPEEAERGVSNAAPLDGRFLTLAEALANAGYRTAAIAANVSFLEAKYGLGQGFDHYDVRRGRVEEINARALEWIDAQDGAPFFLFLNYMDTHRPYNTAPRAGFERVGDHRKVIKRLKRVLLSGEPVPSEWLATLSADYDLAVANLDAGLGELFDALRARGLFDAALIVVTSDHGEYLGEHGFIEHAKDVYEEVVRVPLVVKAPHQALGAVDEAWISHVHLPRLVLEHARVPRDLPELAPLSSNWPRAAVVAENYGARLRDTEEAWGPRLDRLRRAYVRDDQKLIESSDGAHELYDLARDPREQDDLAPRAPGDLELLRAGARAWREQRVQGATAERVLVDAAEEAVLEELGYAAGRDETAGESGEDGE